MIGDHHPAAHQTPLSRRLSAPGGRRSATLSGSDSRGEVAEDGTLYRPAERCRHRRHAAGTSVKADVAVAEIRRQRVSGSGSAKKSATAWAQSRRATAARSGTSRRAARASSPETARRSRAAPAGRRGLRTLRLGSSNRVAPGLGRPGVEETAARTGPPRAERATTAGTSGPAPLWGQHGDVAGLRSGHHAGLRRYRRDVAVGVRRRVVPQSPPVPVPARREARQPRPRSAAAASTRVTAACHAAIMPEIVPPDAKVREPATGLSRSAKLRQRLPQAGPDRPQGGCSQGAAWRRRAT